MPIIHAPAFCFLHVLTDPSDASCQVRKIMPKNLLEEVTVRGYISDSTNKMHRANVDLQKLLEALTFCFEGDVLLPNLLILTWCDIVMASNIMLFLKSFFKSDDVFKTIASGEKV